jgi:MFS family permease
VRFDVFLSFGWEDIKRAEAVAEELAQRGLKVFFAPTTLAKEWAARPLRPWWTRLFEARDALLDKALRAELEGPLSESRCLVLLWGQAARGSAWCEWEVDTFTNKGTRPVLALGDEPTPLPPKLAEIRRFGSVKDLVASTPAPGVPFMQVEGGAGFFDLFLNARAWSSATHLSDPNESALEHFLQPESWKRDRPTQNAQYRRSLLACTALVGGALALGASSGATGWTRSLVLVCAIAAFGGVGLATLQGVGAGLVALVSSVAFGVFGIAAGAAGVGAPIGALAGGLAFGGLIGGAAATRRSIAAAHAALPGEAPRLGVAGGAAVLAGWAIGYGMLAVSFGVRDRFLKVHGLQLALDGWSGLSDWTQASAGSGLGLLAGAAGAMVASQRVSHQVRPRSAPLRFSKTMAAVTAVMMGIGAVAALVPSTGGSLVEALTIGTLCAFVAVSIYLWPTVVLGKRTAEATRAAVGFMGALGLVGMSEAYLRKLPGFEDQRFPAIWAAVVGMFGAFAVLTWTQSHQIGTRWKLSTLASLGLHVAVTVACLKLTKALPMPCDPVPVAIVRKGEPEGTGVGLIPVLPAEPVPPRPPSDMTRDERWSYFQSLPLRRRLEELRKASKEIRRIHWIDHCRAFPKECEDQRQRQRREVRRGVRAGAFTGFDGPVPALGQCAEGHATIGVALPAGYSAMARAVKFGAGDRSPSLVVSRAGQVVLTLPKNTTDKAPIPASETNQVLILSGVGTTLGACGGTALARSFGFEDGGDKDNDEPLLEVELTDQWPDLAANAEEDERYRQNEEAEKKRTDKQ